MRRAHVVAVVVALLVATNVAAVGAAAGLNVSVSAVSVTPSKPMPGETVTVTPTIRNLQSSTDDYTITAVALRTSPETEFRELARVENLGTISPGTDQSVPLTTSFETTGVKDLRVVVFGEDGNGNSRTLTYPVVVRVADERPNVGLATADPVADVPTTATVTVGNGLDEDIRNVEVRLTGSGDVTVDNGRQVLARLAAGATQQLTFTYVADRPRPRELTATVSYTTAGGVRREATETLSVTPDPLRERVLVDARTAQGGNDIAVTVTNFGNAPIENVVVGASAGDGRVGRATVASLAPGSTQTVTLPVSGLSEPATAEVVASYDLADREGRATTTLSVDPDPAAQRPGEITLTGLDAEFEGGTLHLTGTTSNVGLTEVNSVVVSVVPAAGVDPAPPNRDYFVGTVPASDFVSFDLYATVSGNVSSVPVQVTYLVDGERKTAQFSVPVEGVDDGGAGKPDDSSGASWPLLVGGGLLVVAAVAGIVVAWRRRNVGP